jgi:hypothetical protein
MALRRGVELLEQLRAGAVPQRRGPVGELVADPLELAERQQPRPGLCGGGSRRARGLPPREHLGERPPELVLEAGDLVAQVTPSGMLVENDRRWGDGGWHPRLQAESTTGHDADGTFG